MKLRLLPSRDPVHEVIPALEKVIDERDREKARTLLRRFVPRRYQWLFDELTRRA